MEITVRCNTNADANARLPRGGVASLIERVQVLSNGVPCEDTLHYNQLINLLQDMSSSDSDKKGVPARLQGLGEAGGVGADDLYERGALFNNPGGGAVQTEAKTFLVPLQSQWFQSISMVPVHALTDLQYRITLCPNAEGVVSPAANGDAIGYQIEGFTLHLCLR